MVSIAAALACVLAFTVPSASARERTCGKVTLGGVRFAVTIEKGHPGCSTARHVLRVFLSGGGVQHNGADDAHSWTRIGKWTCGHGAGGGGCIRGAKTYVHARDWIIAQAV